MKRTAESDGDGAADGTDSSLYDLILGGIPLPLAAGVAAGASAGAPPVAVGAGVGALLSAVLVAYGLFVADPTGGEAASLLFGLFGD